MNVRALAADVLRDAERVFVDEALEKARTAALSPRDRALLTELVCGTTRRRLTLDYVLDRLTPGKRIAPRVRTHLRLALYEIRHMRVPAYAAVHEAVERCRRVSAKSAGFANAVLRRAIDFPPPLPDGPPARRLSVLHSHPEWLAARWIRAHGEARAEEICAAGNAGLPVTARVRGSDEVVTITGNPADHPVPIQVQDLAQMRAAPLLAPLPGERVLDLCAAPGGKTIHLADLMKGRGEIVAVDVSPERLRLLEEERIPVVRCVAADARKFGETGFDAVLVDVPCSNTAVLSRRADARWRLRPADIEKKLPPLQRALLEAARRAVRPGGRIVYSTCSLEPEENDEVVQAFCRGSDGVMLEEVDLTLPTGESGGGFLARISVSGPR